MKITIECDVIAPKGFEVVRYGLPKAGEYYLYDSNTVYIATNDFKSARFFIVEEIEEKSLTILHVPYGAKFKFKEKPHEEYKFSVGEVYTRIKIDDSVFSYFDNDLKVEHIGLFSTFTKIHHMFPVELI